MRPALPLAVAAASIFAAVAGVWAARETPFAASVWNRLSPFDLTPHPTSDECVEGGQVAGVLRNDGHGWYAINDATHRPVNVAAVETSLFAITVRFRFSAETIHSFMATTDETLARKGFFAGARVGLDAATITLARSGLLGAHRVSPPLVSEETYPLSNIWIFGVFDAGCPA